MSWEVHQFSFLTLQPGEKIKSSVFTVGKKRWYEFHPMSSCFLCAVPLLAHSSSLASLYILIVSIGKFIYTHAAIEMIKTTSRATYII